MSKKIRLGKKARRGAKAIAKARHDLVKSNLLTPLPKEAKSSGDLSSAFTVERLGSKGSRFFGRGRTH